MPAQILQGNVFDLLPTLKPGSVDAVVTSPPYWLLRDYATCPCVVQQKKRPGCTNCDDNGKVPVVRDNQLGMEKTPAEFVANLVRVFRLVREVMADHAVAFCNVGDSYQAGGNLALIPQRLAIALQDDGWLVRSVIVWHKPSPMPASLAGWAWRRCRVKVKSDEAPSGYRADRPECSPNGDGVHYDHRRPPNAQWADCPGCDRCTPHGGYVLRRGSWRPTSSWEPLLMLAKTGRYFSDGEPVKTPSLNPPGVPVLTGQHKCFTNESVRNGTSTSVLGANYWEGGANARDVQSWSAEPLSEKHYAAFPTALVRWCLLCGTSAKGYCPRCGLPWCRVVESKFNIRPGRVNTIAGCRDGGPEERGWDGMPTGTTETTTIGWRPSCSCSPVQEPRRGLVLDPFAGSGRTGLTAARMGLDFAGVELSPEYAQMARRLLHEDAPLFQRNGHAD